MTFADGGVRPAYDVQFATAVGGQVIVGLEVATVTDATQLGPVVDQLRTTIRPDRESGFSTPTVASRIIGRVRQTAYCACRARLGVAERSAGPETADDEACRAGPADNGLDLPLPHNSTVLHDQAWLAKRPRACERIALHGDKICLHARPQSTDLIA